MVTPASAGGPSNRDILDAPLASDHQPVLTVLEWIGASGGGSRGTR